MENAEERKKMKKIEKEEQLKKKLEQTMEEKMAADSKTVEGESAVVKAEEGNTATEQEPETAPALSEEELNAMYERFQQRLQKEGLADAEGNPTEKTLEIRRQIVERKIDEAQKEIKEKLHLPVPEFYYIPAGMEYSKYMVFEDTQIAWIEYQYNEHIVYFQLAANENDLSQGSWKDKEKVQVDTLDEAIEVEVGTISENDEENYYALWRYKDAYYQLSGQIEKEELIKILNEMQYNV